jgi:hypothetical protein
MYVCVQKEIGENHIMSNENAVIKYYKGNETEDEETDCHVARMEEMRNMYKTLVGN